MTEEKIAILGKTELFRGLDGAVLAVLAASAVEKKLERDQILFLAGDRADGMYVVCDGSLRAYRTASDGREQVIHVEKAITTIAEVAVFDGGNYPSTVAAEESSVVLFLEREKVIETCFRFPEVALASARLLAKRLRNCAELVESLSLHEVIQRLALLLLTEAAAVGAGQTGSAKFKLSMTHNQLAARIGTVREVVTRSLFRLQSKGLISNDRKYIEIPDVAALRSFISITE